MFTGEFEHKRIVVMKRRRLTTAWLWWMRFAEISGQDAEAAANDTPADIQLG